MDELETFLIIGLGNPGSAYDQTRHNVGFRIVETFAEKHKLKFKHASELIGDVAQGKVGEKQGVLLLPTTYMNSSGVAVKRCVDRFKVPMDHLMVVCDDIALDLGTMRIRSKGSPGGHNGLKSIQAHLNTEHYARFRIGISPPGQEKLEDYVLGTFSPQEQKVIEEMTTKAVEVLELWMAAGIAMAMRTANARNKDEEEGENNG